MPGFPLKLVDVSLSRCILWDSCMVMCTRGRGHAAVAGIARQTQNKEALLSG